MAERTPDQAIPPLTGQSRRRISEWQPIVAIISIAAIVGIGVVYRSPSLWISVLFIGWLVMAMLMRPRFWMYAMLFLSIAAHSLSVYQVPLTGARTLQLFRALLLVSIGLWTLRILLGRLRVPRRIPATGMYLVLVFVYVLVSFLLNDLRDEGSLSILVAIAFGLLYALWLPQVIRKPSELKLVVLGIGAANLLVIAFAVYQSVAWVTGLGMRGRSFEIPLGSIWDGLAMSDAVTPTRAGSWFRLTLPFGSSSHLGAYIAATLLVTLPLQAQAALPRCLRRWLPLYHVIMTLLVVATLSRAAWVGLAAGVLVLLAYRKPSIVSRGVASTFAILLVISLAVLAIWPDVAKIVLARFDTALTESSDETHIEFVRMAVALSSQHPVFGSGLGSFEVLTGIAHPHNIYLHILAELGIAGLSLWLGWFLLTLWTGHRTIVTTAPGSLEHQVALGFLAAFVATLVNNLFQQSLYFGFALFIPGALGAIALFRSNRHRTKSRSETYDAADL